jgi:hypothetical protein
VADRVSFACMCQISQPLRIARGSGGVNVLVVPATEHLPPLDAVKLGVTRDGEEPGSSRWLLVQRSVGSVGL